MPAYLSTPKRRPLLTEILHWNMALPTALEKELECFKKEYGSGWSQKVVRLLEEEIKRKKAKKKLAGFMQTTSGRVKLSEREIFQRLESRP